MKRLSGKEYSSECFFLFVFAFEVTATLQNPFAFSSPSERYLSSHHWNARFYIKTVIPQGLSHSSKELNGLQPELNFQIRSCRFEWSNLPFYQ